MTIYSTAMGDVLLEREFNYLLNGISHVHVVSQNINDRRLRKHIPPNSRQVWGVTP